MRRFVSAALLTAALLSAAGCSTMSRQPPLRVGMTPNYPPIIHKQGEAVTGLEAEFAVRLSRALKRPLQMMEMPWEQLVPNLLSGDIDVIMSGMTATDARRVRIDFCDPLLTSGQMALIRRADAKRYTTVDSIIGLDGHIGVVKGTEGDTFVQSHCLSARPVQFTYPNDAALALQTRRLDVVIDDAPSAWWMASKFESDLTVMPTLLNEEPLAWGIHPASSQLKQEINAILGVWRADGTLDTVLHRWVPFLLKK